jgi:hypothetical protein
MRTPIFIFLAVLVFLSSAAGAAFAQGDERAPRQEVGLTLGSLLSRERTAGPTRLELGPGVAYRRTMGTGCSSVERLHSMEKCISWQTLSEKLTLRIKRSPGMSRQSL